MGGSLRDEKFGEGGVERSAIGAGVRRGTDCGHVGQMLVGDRGENGDEPDVEARADD